jgi:hypothetical protein
VKRGDGAAGRSGVTMGRGEVGCGGCPSTLHSGGRRVYEGVVLVCLMGTNSF